MNARRLIALLLAIGVLAVSAFGALVGTFWGFDMTCGDSCAATPLWRDDPDAWQWEAMGLASIGGLTIALLFVLAVAFSRRLLGGVLLAAWAAVAVIFLNLFRDSGLTSHSGRGWAGLTLLVLVGLASLGLAPRRRRFARRA